MAQNKIKRDKWRQNHLHLPPSLIHTKPWQGQMATSAATWPKPLVPGQRDFAPTYQTKKTPESHVLIANGDAITSAT